MKSVSIATRRLRCWIPSLGLVLALGLGACGGGDGGGLGGGDGVKRAALAASATEPDLAQVVSLSKVSETRISRTVYDYVYRVTLLNGAYFQQDVVATVKGVGVGTTIIDGVVAVGNMAAREQRTPDDTITLRHDRAKPFDLAAVTWSVIGAKITGRVIDGYISGATVYWDCNRDGKFTEGELSVKTGAGGAYTISDMSLSSCDLLADVPHDAVDEDFPTQTVGIPFTMATIPSKREIITP